MPLFVLSPASLAHSALFAGYYSYLNANVSAYFALPSQAVNWNALRIKTGIMLGDGETGSVRDPSIKPNVKTQVADEAALKRAVRSAANFSEQTPFAFFLIFISELNGAPTALCHGAFTLLFAARVAHDTGIKADNAVGLGRPIGFALTTLLTIVAGSYNLSLGYQPLKAFLGFAR